MTDIKRYDPELANSATPWPNPNIKLLEAVMAEREDGEYYKVTDVDNAMTEKDEIIKHQAEQAAVMTKRIAELEQAIVEIKCAWHSQNRPVMEALLND